MDKLMLDYVLPCLWAFAACIGFTFIFNIRGFAGKCICGLGGAIGWLVYLLFDKSVPGAFVAAVCIGVFSEAMARLRRCPATAYLLVALLPLVPGGGVYYAMSYCVAGQRDLFLTTLLNTFGVAAALAIGAMLASSLFRALFPRFPHFFRKNP
jgi:uncharacterized membrane protein YjjB (DUF3815 family)